MVVVLLVANRPHVIVNPRFSNRDSSSTYRSPFPPFLQPSRDLWTLLQSDVGRYGDSCFKILSVVDKETHTHTHLFKLALPCIVEILRLRQTHRVRSEGSARERALPLPEERGRLRYALLQPHSSTPCRSKAGLASCTQDGERAPLGRGPPGQSASAYVLNFGTLDSQQQAVIIGGSDASGSGRLLPAEKQYRPRARSEPDGVTAAPRRDRRSDYCTPLALPPPGAIV